MSRRYNSIRIFKRDWMEVFTHVHPLTPLIVWMPIVLWLLTRSFTVHDFSIYAVAGIGAVALFSWSFAEYILHRFVFHFHATTPAQERLQFLIHGLHHADPIDPTRLVMPPFLGAVIAVILFTLFKFAMGPRYVEPFFAFFLVGYLCYDYIHFSVHHFKPRTRIGKMLKQNHMLHHFQTPNARWGVSSPLWDHVFGTAETPKEERAV